MVGVGCFCFVLLGVFLLIRDKNLLPSWLKILKELHSLFLKMQSNISETQSHDFGALFCIEFWKNYCRSESLKIPEISEMFSCNYSLNNLNNT